MSFLFGGRSSKTFKPKKHIPEGTHQYDLMKHAAATLGSGNLRSAVMLPEGEDLNEWIAVNTVDFFNQINMLYGTITEMCTEESCPVMSAGPKYEYHWADGQTVKKPIKCSAPKYIDYLMTWVQDQLDDEMLFPSKIGVPFPKNFISNAKTILKRLFRVYAHIYHQHFSEVVQLGEEAHLNTSFKHFIFFVQMLILVTAFLVCSSALATNELSDAEARRILKLTLTAAASAGNSSSTATNTIYIEDDHEPPFALDNYNEELQDAPPTLYRETVLNNLRRPYERPRSYVLTPYSEPTSFLAPERDYSYKYGEYANKYRPQASGSYNNDYDSLRSVFNSPWGAPIDYSPDAAAPYKEVHPHTDMKPGFCPPLRSECPQVGARTLRPRPCSSDTHCEVDDKCCYDQCLKRYACKPTRGPQYTYKK